MYLYPNNLKAKPKLWLWQLKELVIIGITTLIAVLFYSQFNNIYPLVGSAVYALLSLRLDDMSMLDFIIHSCHFFIFSSQTYTWSNERSLNDNTRK